MTEIHNPVTVRFSKVLRESDKAYLIEFEDNMGEVWFPKSLTVMIYDKRHIVIPKRFCDEYQLGAFREENDPSITDTRPRRQALEFIKWKGKVTGAVKKKTRKSP